MGVAGIGTRERLQKRLGAVQSGGLVLSSILSSLNASLDDAARALQATTAKPIDAFFLLVVVGRSMKREGPVRCVRLAD